MKIIHLLTFFFKFWSKFLLKVRDCQQITFLILNNRFFPLSNPQPPTPLFLTDNIKMDKIPMKIKWKIHSLFLHLFQVLKVATSYKKLLDRDTATWSFISCFYCSFYISRYVIFHQFLELHSTLSEKKNSSQIFLF